MGKSFWMSQLGALFIAAFSIFISPYIQRWRDKRAIAKGQKHTEEVKRHYSRVVVYAIEPHSLTQYLILQGMLAVGALVNIILGVSIELMSPLYPLVAEQLFSHVGYIRMFSNAGGMLFVAFGIVTLNRITGHATTLWSHVQSFDKYIASVPAEFRNYDLERLASEKVKFPP